MNNIKHQLANQPFYTPNWEVKYLLLGTFNPDGGELVKYYYGRPKNQTWRILSELFSEDFDPKKDDFLNKLKLHKIACMDMIHQVNSPSNRLNEILGKSYKDTAIINKFVNRTYRTDSILQVIANNNNIQVFSTWGNGLKLKDWKNEVNKIQEIIPLVSPSLAARVPKGTNKYNYMLNDWKIKFNLG
ncbi:MAG: hypothetical protein L6Q78_13495 [Bacteroidia bacterium]|nr:hypothetical protein [Bacteroidia bacterium]